MNAVRSRIVKNSSQGCCVRGARELGISSPPSADAMMVALSWAATHGLVVASADVSSAFMHTPLRQRDVIVRLPLSTTSLTGEPLFLHLSRALNGIRKASVDWTCFLSDIVKTVGKGKGLTSCNLEPCLFAGRLPSGPVALLAYVDDLLLVCSKTSDIQEVFGPIGRHVELKQTGLIEESGSIKFLGRTISRQRGSKDLLIGLPKDYLDDTFKAYGLCAKSSKGSTVKTMASPDVALSVEKECSETLSPESYARFRAALGKVAWISQTRQDLRSYVGILATRQAVPNQEVEKGMRNLLRFLMTDMNTVLRLPADGTALTTDVFPDEGEVRHMVCYSDASHAPLRTTKRRGISGGVLGVFGCCIKTLSRHQQSVALSSMESELWALQSVAQEMSSLGRLLGRLYANFFGGEPKDFPGVLYSDSESSLKLLKNLDLPRKSRHLEIRIEWLKSRIEDGHLVLEFKRGNVNPADLLTKCLGSAAFGYHRSALGFEVLTSPIQSLMNISNKFVFVEVCCRPQSSISQVCSELGIPYVGITADMEKKQVFSSLKLHLDKLGCKYKWIHVSSPCSSGSPLRYLCRDVPTEADWEWFDLFPSVRQYMLLGTFSSFELPWFNAIWNYRLCKDTLKATGHNYATDVKLCNV